jgi:electron transfer flavoprotein alpha subunit
MKAENGKQYTESKNIWIIVQHREGTIENETFGLIAEARRIISECDGNGTVTAVALGSGLKKILESLGAHATDKILYAESEFLSRYHGALFAKVLCKMANKYKPTYILMAQSPETADLSSRLAALMETALVTRAMDFKIDETGKVMATRPVANGYLFENLTLDCQSPPIICFLPAVLSASEPGTMRKMEIVTEPVDEQVEELKAKVVEIIEADPEELDIEEADIIVSGGRGVGKAESFNLMHELALTIGGSVGGTRPIIDWQILPFERQIGQTGKTVAPRLIFACGISGANEFTAGMEKSQLVIAINTDPHARIFRFADLGVIGDVHEVVPCLIEALKKIKESN